MSGARSRAEQAADRELAALVDGPWAPAWYWRDELEAQQQAGRRMHQQYARRWATSATTDPPSSGSTTPPRQACAAAPGPTSHPSRTAAAVGGGCWCAGSRTWTDELVIAHVLAAEWDDGTAVLVSGACPRGADRIAEQIWAGWGGQVERHPGDWNRHGRAAGFRRNTHMVALGADVCLAFIREYSRGAAHTAQLAEAADIPTRRYTPTHRKDT
jgi:hypothetical protein